MQLNVASNVSLPDRLEMKLSDVAIEVDLQSFFSFLSNDDKTQSICYSVNMQYIYSLTSACAYAVLFFFFFFRGQTFSETRLKIFFCLIKGTA